ncbi:MAG: hypothetical protein HKN44_03845, partial [Ilumatobacter sp.]|nr:hypothetical protein [Ilumatobacter sp.]
GGGIVAFGGELIVDETTVSGNRAIGSGFAQALGGGLRRDGPIWVTDSTIDGNAAVAEDATTMADGGGVWLSGGSPTAPLMFVNSTISNNSAERSGGIHQEAGDLSIIATTVTANSSPNLAGGIWVGGDLSITASIVAGNGAVEDMGDFGGTASSGGYNVMGELDLGAPFDRPGDIIIGTGDPLLGPLADNGGPTRTHRPLRGSPALDRVTGTYQDRPTVDQRGIARPQGTHADSGSVEREVVFTSQVPQRFADSRSEDTFDGIFRDTGLRAGGSVWEIDVAGRGQVPTEAAAAIVNVTVVGAVAPGHATVYPCSAKVPTASSINYLPGSVEPNELIAKLSGDGALCITTLTTAHVIVDVVGWASGTSPYVPVDPTRYADSRDEPTFDSQQRHTGIRARGTTWEIPIAGRGIVPASATAAAVNLTVTAGTDHGFATVHPCGALPLASSLNYGPGITRPNELLAKLSPTGTICVYTSADVHVIVDVVGYLGTTLSYTPIVPARYADSRDEPTFDDLQRHTGIRGGGTTWEIPIAGRGVVPAGAGSATVNLTVTESTAPGHATVYPCGIVPLASSINYAPGVTRPNELVAKLSPTGTICVFTLADVHVIVDVVGHDS